MKLKIISIYLTFLEPEPREYLMVLFEDRLQFQKARTFKSMNYTSKTWVRAEKVFHGLCLWRRLPLWMPRPYSHGVTVKTGHVWKKAADASWSLPRAAFICLSYIWSFRKESPAIRVAVFCTGSYCHIDFKGLKTKWPLLQTHKVSCATYWEHRCLFEIPILP